MQLKTEIAKVSDQQNICGVSNRNIEAIEKLVEVGISINGSLIYVDSNDLVIIERLEHLFSMLLEISANNYTITPRDCIYVDKMLSVNKRDEIFELYAKPKLLGRRFNGENIYPKTLNQKIYHDNLEKKDIIFGIGPAGTGKTYLAVAYAVTMLKEHKVKKIILTRPAVEAGESLGFLPGDLKEKIDPYLRPLYDALYDTLGPEQTRTLIEAEIIEIAPLAYMRGRTLENSVIVLDEAQNTTTKQMKMFLTRIGFRSKMIITGDHTQIDLPKGVNSGLIEAKSLLKGIPEIGIIEFANEDVVRHPLVAKILARYEREEN